ncbi:aminotransferase-like domain-containing protein [Oceanibacterium hippocampi]|uniref:Putative HTH-type transcriptional regulator YjiR n=1 Tax=Oceanibacterium hippocampi TaxID=745714 RepID=A0A1Y5TUJ5_9PROT|nr:PLP-dependent aminotransferase family protein [Oceanibacterium hippocampi]SLN73271.1 putative HTH-type transcriptional regulator YjiR [Oceanibacterium hippocampi]
MTIWQPTHIPDISPRYRAIAEAVIDAVARGELPGGSQLPPQRQLAWKLGVTVGTISRAYSLLQELGMLSGEVGRGSFIRDEAARAESARLAPAEDGLIDLTRAVPILEQQGPLLAKTLRRIADQPDLAAMLAYPPGDGHRPFREAGAAWMKRVGVDAEPDLMALANGNQQGFSVAIGMLARPGDTILSEGMTWPGFAGAARMFGVRLGGVDFDEHGMRPDALERAVSRTGARVVVVVPALHNPTSAVMPEERRRAIVEVARRHDLMLIEDAVYAHQIAEPVVALASLAPERTVYLSSLSKSISGGLRVAWVKAPEQLRGALTDAVHSLYIQPPPLTFQVARQWIDDGTADRLCADQRRAAERRQRIARELLDGLDYLAHPQSFNILLSLPQAWRAEDFVRAARSRGVSILAAEEFVVGGYRPPEAVRISVSGARDDMLARRGIGIVAGLAREIPPSRGTVI